MSFRTVVRDGLIVINTHGEIPDGTPVEVLPTSRGTTKKTAKSPARKSKKKTKKKTIALDKLPAFGMWKNRPEWKGKSTLEVLAELRAKSLGRHRRA